MNSESLIKIILLLGVVFSIVVCYYVMLVREDYEVFYNDDGLPLLDEE